MPASSLLVILLGCALLYYQGLFGPFVFDDFDNISPTLMTEWDLSRLFAIAAANESGLFGRPVSIVSFSLTSLLFGASPFAFKLTNLFLHLITGVALFSVLKIVFVALTGRNDNKALTMTLWCCALWLMHPLLVSTVLYAVQRMAILSNLFMLLGMWFYLRGRLAIPGQGLHGYVYIFASFFVATPLAILAKENGVLILVFLPLLEWIVLQPHPGVSQKNQFRLFWWIICGIGSVSALLLLIIANDTLLGGYAMRDFNLLERLYTQIHALVFYLGQIVLPGLVELSLFHDDFAVVRSPTLLTLACFASLITFLVMIMASKVIHAIVRLGLAWFLVAHLVESTILPLEMIWEHRNYLAAAGPIMILVFVINELAAKLPNTKIQPIPLAALLLLFAALTWSRNGTWSDEELLAQHLAESKPNSVRSVSLLAQTYAQNNDIERANEVLEVGAANNPQSADILMQQLTYNCSSPEAAAQLRLRLSELLKSTFVSNYVMSDLARLTFVASVGSCESVSPIVVLGLLDAVFENPTLNLEPTHPGIFQLLVARNLLPLNRIDDALLRYDLALELDQTSQPWRIPLEKAGILWRIGRQEEARALRESVLRNFADDQRKFRFQDQLERLDQIMSTN
ncbi:MAG: hypothetical protein GKR91_09140 [Pseudomonadales bacterium]|nr:hypothetical protein [Pseudomonadales bacterium]